MKTKIFFIAGLTAMLLTCQTMQAQLKYGVHAAGNLETQAALGQLWNNVDLYQGFLIGGFLEFNAGNKLSFQTEINYQKKGAKITSNSDGIESIERKEFNYVSVPLLIKGNIHDPGLNDKCDLTFFTGPYIGFLTSANSNIKTGKITTSVDMDNLAEKIDWGIVFGGGVSYKLGNGGALIAELRYEMGLSKVDKQDPDLRNKGMGLTLGYRF
jgi:Outer membrane protein beta-barrel domain